MLSSGTALLFNDPRVDWALGHLRRFGVNVEQSDFLELGPLEGGHTYALSRAGAKSVTAIEANVHAYLKCLVAREVLGYERTKFLFGDAMEYLRADERQFDVTFASGFLYHMQDPVECLEQLARRSKAIFLWTVYWDHAFSVAHPERKAGSDGVHLRPYRGRDLSLHRHGYGEGINYQTFWGGPDTHSHWMELPDILDVLRINGLDQQYYELEPNPNGAALRLVAVRSNNNSAA